MFNSTEKATNSKSITLQTTDISDDDKYILHVNMGTDKGLWKEMF